MAAKTAAGAKDAKDADSHSNRVSSESSSGTQIAEGKLQLATMEDIITSKLAQIAHALPSP